AKTLPKLLAFVAHEIVFSGNVENLLCARRFEDLLHIVELRRLRQVADVAGVQNEFRSHGQCVDLVDCSRKVATTSGFAGLSNPMWLSLICTNANSPLGMLVPFSPPRPSA